MCIANDQDVSNIQEVELSIVLVVARIGQTRIYSVVDIYTLVDKDTYNICRSNIFSWINIWLFESMTYKKITIKLLRNFESVRHLFCQITRNSRFA